MPFYATKRRKDKKMGFIMGTVLTDYFNVNAERLKNKKLFLLDMDGTIYNENTLFKGTPAFLKSIKDIGAKYVFVTNNSSKSVVDYLQKITKMGISADESNFYTSTMATATFLKEKFNDKLIYAQGTKSFIAELKKYGLSVTTEYNPSAAAIVLGFDTELTFEKLSTTSKMLCTTNAEYYASHPDFVCPVEYGFVPDLGSMCFGLEKASGKTPTVIGKPMPTMLYSAMAREGVTKEQTVVIGDRLSTDITSGHNAGVDAICVLSGEATLEDIKHYPIKPDFVFEGIEKIIL